MATTQRSAPLESPPAQGGLSSPPASDHPKLRGDLLLRRSKTQPVHFELKAPEARSACMLYDFELALARRMDGRTSLDALARSVEGVPQVTPEQLDQFIRQLARYHLLEEAIPPPIPSAQLGAEVTTRVVKEELSQLLASTMALGGPDEPGPTMRHTVNAQVWLERASYWRQDSWDRVRDSMEAGADGLSEWWAQRGTGQRRALLAGVALFLLAAGSVAGWRLWRARGVQWVRADAAGVVTQLGVRDGQEVEAGQLLLELDGPALRERLAAANAEVAEAQAQGVQEAGNAEEIRARYEAARQRRDRLEEALERARLRAPVRGRVVFFDGSLQGREVKAGQRLVGVAPAR